MGLTGTKEMTIRITCHSDFVHAYKIRLQETLVKTFFVEEDAN